MPDCLLEFGEHVLVAQRDPVRIDVGVAASDVKQRRYLVNIVRHDERVRFSRRLERIVPRRRDPVVLQIAPRATQGERVDRSVMAVARQHDRGAHPQYVDVVALTDIEQQRLERHCRRLWHPVPLVAVEHEATRDQCVGDHAHGLRQLVGDLAQIDRTAGRRHRRVSTGKLRSHRALSHDADPDELIELASPR